MGVPEEIDARCERWARWRVHANDTGLGYPRQSSEQRLPIKNHRGFRPLPDWTEEIATEMAICRMPKELQIVVWEYYLGIGTCEQKAKRLAISRQTFHHRRNSAIHWLTGFFDGVTQSTNGC